MAGEHLLNDSWTLYFHDPWSADWTFDSYVRLGDLVSIEEFVAVSRELTPILHKGMWFLSREGVFPAWDDPANLNGGCLSLKVLKHEAHTYFDRLGALMLGESLLADKASEGWQHVNCLSLSPKRHFCIIKLWLGDGALDKGEFFDLGGYNGEALFKSNRDNITHNNPAAAR